MPLFAPSSYGQLNKIIGLAGNTSQGLLNQKTPGVGDIRSTFGAMEKNPDTVLPGGGTLGGGGPLSRYLQTEVPAATLPLYQGETGRRLGLVGTQEGLAGLQTGEQDIQTQRMAAFRQLLSQLLPTLGATPTQTNLGGGAFRILGQILGI